MQTKLKQLVVKGSHYDVGIKIGNFGKKKIQQVINANKEIFPVIHRKSKNFRNLYNSFLKLCLKEQPELVSELKGMAKGANVSFEDIFILNVRELETLIVKEKSKSCIGCTTLCIPRKDRVFLGHNEDGMVTDDIFILKAQIGGYSKFLSVCYYGLLPGSGIALNEHRILHSQNFLSSSDIRIGIPYLFHVRSLLKGKNVDETLTLITKTKRAKGENYIFCQGSICYNVETTAKRSIVKRITKPYAHTNHYREKELKQWEKRFDNIIDTTHSRLRVANQFLKENDVKTLFQLKKALRSHDNSPKALCCHDFDGFRTLGSILFDSSKQEINVCYRNPCKSRYYTYKLD